MKIFINLLGLFILLISLNTKAALISSDDTIFGANSITSDLTNNLEWLDLTLSKGYSYNELIAETSAGGKFNGFHLAEIEEVQTLFDSAMLPLIGNTTTDFAAIDELIGLIGSTSSQGGFLESLGITATVGISGFGHRVTGLDFLTVNGVPLYTLTDTLTFGDSFGPETVGGWLVRDARAVMEPPTMLVFLAGLIALFASRYRYSWRR